MCFVTFIAASAKFKDKEYSVVEGDRVFIVEIEKVGTTADTVGLLIQYIGGTAMRKELLYHSDSRQFLL